MSRVMRYAREEISRAGSDTCRVRDQHLRGAQGAAGGDGQGVTMAFAVEIMERARHNRVMNDTRGTARQSAALTNNPRFRKLIDASRRSYRDEGGIALEDLRQELG